MNSAYSTPSRPSARQSSSSSSYATPPQGTSQNTNSQALTPARQPLSLSPATPLVENGVINGNEYSAFRSSFASKTISPYKSKNNTSILSKSPAGSNITTRTPSRSTQSTPNGRWESPALREFQEYKSRMNPTFETGRRLRMNLLAIVGFYMIVQVTALRDVIATALKTVASEHYTDWATLAGELEARNLIKPDLLVSLIYVLFAFNIAESLWRYFRPQGPIPVAMSPAQRKVIGIDASSASKATTSFTPPPRYGRASLGSQPSPTRILSERPFSIGGDERPRTESPDTPVRLDHRRSVSTPLRSSPLNGTPNSAASSASRHSSIYRPSPGRDYRPIRDIRLLDRLLDDQ